VLSVSQSDKLWVCSIGQAVGLCCRSVNRQAVGLCFRSVRLTSGGYVLSVSQSDKLWVCAFGQSV